MKKKDLILICSVLVLAVAFWLVPRAVGLFGNSKEQKLRITVSGEEYGTYSLEEDQVIKVGDTNICEIKDKKVSMISADCPDQLCIHQRTIQLQGETIVCLPNKVVLEITGTRQTDQEALDGVVN
nr:NusG domain II-containing protein [uncultured Blautia sp.]